MKQTEFYLRKLKVDAKTVVVNYSKQGSDEEIQSTKHNAPHPDMRKKLDKLKPLLIAMFQMDADQSDNFNINGIVLSSLKDTDQVMVLANYVTPTGQKITINSPNTILDGGDYEIQDKMISIVGNIVDEVYDYLFGKKQAQMDLVTEAEEQK